MSWHDSPSLSSRGRAIVIGGSMAGLLAARVLSPRFGRVTILDRDRVARDSARTDSASRRAGTATECWRVVCGCSRACSLASRTTSSGRRGAGRRRRAMSAGFSTAATRREFDIGLRAILLSRPLLEATVRQHVLALPNVDLIDRTHVVGLTLDARRSGSPASGSSTMSWRERSSSTAIWSSMRAGARRALPTGLARSDSAARPSTK